METKGRGGGVNRETGIDSHAALCVDQITMRTNCRVQGTLLSALKRPEWEGNPKRRRHMYTCG